MRAPLIALLSVACCRSPPSQVDAHDPWDALRPLVGHWEGTYEGFAMIGECEGSWEFVLSDKFLRGRLRSIDGNSVHDDLEMLSWDQTRACFVLRRFSSTGYVIQLAGTIQEDGSLIMESEAWENGFPYEVRAKSTLTFVSQDEIHMAYYLAFDDGPFGPMFSQVKWRRSDR